MHALVNGILSSLQKITSGAKFVIASTKFVEKQFLVKMELQLLEQ